MATVAEALAPKYSGDTRADMLFDWSSDVFYSGILNYIPNSNNTIYYSFNTNNVSRVVWQGSVALNNVEGFNNQQKVATQEALNYVSDITGIHFQYTDDVNQANLFFGNADIVGSSNIMGETLTYLTQDYKADKYGNVTYYHPMSVIALDKSNHFAYDLMNPVKGNYGYATILHELGHFLGLQHPNNNPNSSNTEWTIMSYVGDQPRSTFSPCDLFALQWLYGGDGLAGNYGINSTYGTSLVSYNTALNQNAQQHITEISVAYLSYFGRPADVSGANYWAENLGNMLPSFSQSDESKNLFGSEFSKDQINQFYLNLFNRNADDAGLDYWYNEVTSGNISAGNLAVSLATSALSQTNTADFFSVYNKLSACETFTWIMDRQDEQIAYANNVNSVRAKLQTIGSTNPVNDADISFYLDTLL